MMTVVQSARKGQRIACSSATYRRTCPHTKSYDLKGLTDLVVDNMLAELTDPEFLKERAKTRAQEFARQVKEDNSERQATQKQLDRLNVQIARLVAAIEDSDQPVKELMASIKAKEIERVALQERVRLLGSEDNVMVLHPAALQAWSKNIEAFHAKLKRNPNDPECRLAFANVVDRVLVHQTAKGERYEVSVYARLAAVAGGIELFPAQRSHQEILAAEGLTRNGSVGTVSSRPQSSSRSTGW